MKNIVASRDNDVEPFEVVIRNRQRGWQFRADIIQRFTDRLLREELRLNRASLGIAFLGADAMAKANQQFLSHTGATDVITFDHSEPDVHATASSLHGEIFICLDDALAHARRFGTIWQSELTRYVIHGILHLRGYDDLSPELRRKMKREENRLLKGLTDRFDLSKLARSGKVPS